MEYGRHNVAFFKQLFGGGFAVLGCLSNDGAKVRIIFGLCKFWGGFCQEKLKNHIFEALNLQNGHKNPSLRRNKGRKKRSLLSLKGTY